ncbi:hypothetical protein IGL24_002138 [Enterococcus sp. DIV2371]|uniref:GLUG motif-containing protein n=1 Tax=Enterococcus sp. DIV2371 TaxID=2774927 RepID=UPI003D288876
MRKLNKKKLLASVLLSSMMLAQTAPTFASVLDSVDPMNHPVAENEETVEELDEIENLKDEIMDNEVESNEVEALEDASDIRVETEENAEEPFPEKPLSLSDEPEEADLPEMDEAETFAEPIAESQEENEDLEEISVSSRFTGVGDGTAVSPYQITNEEQLNEMRADLTAHYRIMNDITLTSAWIPVGYYSTSFDAVNRNFRGSLTAEPGTVIRNLTITANSSDTVSGQGYRGLFATTDGATISGITIENPRVVAGDGAGTAALIGRVRDSTDSVTRVSDSRIIGGSIESTMYGFIGGLIGYAGASIVSRSSSSASIRFNSIRSQGVGGLLGVSTSGQIIDSYATGDVTSTQVNTGGLIGNNSGGRVTRSYATGNVTSSGDYTGGLIGLNDSDAAIYDSYATGNVNGNENTGGLVGMIDSGVLETQRSYSTGNVIGTNYTGGFVGRALGATTIQNSYSMGDVSGTGNVDVFGGGEGNKVNNYYYHLAKVLDGGAVPEQLPDDLGILEPVDVIELRTQTTYIENGWDFNSVWLWDTETNYPKLGLGNEVDTLPMNALGETIQVTYSGPETRIPLAKVFSLIGRGGNPEDFLIESSGGAISISEDGNDLIMEIDSVGVYELTAVPLRRLTTLEPGQNWGRATIEVTPAEITVEKGRVFEQTFNGTREILDFERPTLSGLIEGDEINWQEEVFQFTDPIAGTNTIEGDSWQIDWGTVNQENYEVVGVSANENGEYQVTDLFEVEGIVKAAGAFLRIDEELAAQNNTHEVITIAGTALLHHDETPDTPGEQWYHDHVEELLQDVTFLIYDTDPQANPLARVVAYADGVAAVDGAFVGLSVNTTYWITATSDESANFNAGEESDPIVLTTSLSGDNGGNGDNGGDNGGTGGNTGNTGNNIGAPSGSNQTGNNQSGNNQSGNNQSGTTPTPNGGSVNTSGSGNGSVPTNAASAGTNGRSGNLPKTGEVASAFALLGFGAVGTALASWLKGKKKN